MTNSTTCLTNETYLQSVINRPYHQWAYYPGTYYHMDEARILHKDTNLSHEWQLSCKGRKYLCWHDKDWPVLSAYHLYMWSNILGRRLTPWSPVLNNVQKNTLTCHVYRRVGIEFDVKMSQKVVNVVQTGITVVSWHTRPYSFADFSCLLRLNKECPSFISEFFGPRWSIIYNSRWWF